MYDQNKNSKVKFSFNRAFQSKNHGYNDNDVYNNDNNEYTNYIKTEEDIENEQPTFNKPKKAKLTGYTAPQDLIMEDIESGPHEETLNLESKKRQIATRESEYQGKKRLRNLSPKRADPWAKNSGKESEENTRTYKDIVMEQRLENDRQNYLKEAQRQYEAKKKEKEREKKQQLEHKKKQKSDNASVASSDSNTTKLTNQSMKSEWDQVDKPSTSSSKWDTPVRNENNLQSSQRRKRWDLTPINDPEATPNLKGGNNFSLPSFYSLSLFILH